jgi:type II secretory pathway pseudopilin PulG
MRPLPQLDRKPSGRHGSARVDEAGFMLLAAVVMVAVLLIALSVAAPIVARQLRRDKEIESQHRMEQYVRAIQLYQRKFPGQYPASIKILENTNNVRFLRHVYVDPLTGKADYKLIHQGEQQTKIHVFFGKELDGLAASLGSAAGMQSGGGLGAASSGPTSVTSTNPLNAGYGGASIGGSSSLGSSSPTSSDPTSTNGTTGSNGSTSGTNGTTSGPSSTSSDALGSDSLGVIVGVGTSKSGTSITEPNAQTTYESWEFWYDPRIEMLKQGVNVTGGGMTSQSASGFGSSATSGQPNTGGTSIFGSTGVGGLGSSTGATGTTSTSSTTGTSGSGSTNPNNPFSSPF